MNDRRWSYRIFRAVSIYVTWALLHTSISANTVTWISLAVAAVGLIAAASSTGPGFVVGIALLFVYHLLDRVDGELARARKQYSLLGIYLDNVGHFATFATTLPVAAVAYFRWSSLHDGIYLPDAATVLVLVLGFFGGISMAMSRAAKLSGFQILTQYVVERPELLETVTRRDTSFSRAAVKRSRIQGRADQRGDADRVRDLILVWTQYPTVIAVLLVGGIASWLTADTRYLGVAVVVQSLSQSAAWIGVEALNLRGNLGSEVHRLWGELQRTFALTEVAVENDAPTDQDA